MRTFDFTPLYRSAIGFDRMFNDVENLFQNKADSYPPYNIEKKGQDSYRITLAVAGFEEAELSLSVEQNLLLVKGKKAKAGDNSRFLYQGISEQDFELKFRLADHVQVEGAGLNNGLLTIDLKREIPEALKPRRIEIGQAPVLEHRPTEKSDNH
ncbi:Hsp20 family protein [Zobellella maritima]|uniref:Hsp20 family protein n=1 Tax=Zobellella maritima TaxID=2059725 RepID=UPI000E306951|nr:Hsp20 family protein [Zobellella maritima]